jgi:hypothetical protein
MKKSYIITLSVASAFYLAFAFGPAVSSAQIRTGSKSHDDGNPHLQKVSGVMMTNIRAEDQTALGIVTGDLRGAMAARILEFDPANGRATVQHQVVTESGDTVTFAPTPVSFVPGVGGDPSLVHVLVPELVITGGTGRFAGATGKIRCHGSIDYNNANGGETVFRYSGEVNFPN